MELNQSQAPYWARLTALMDAPYGAVPAHQGNALTPEIAFLFEHYLRLDRTCHQPGLDIPDADRPAALMEAEHLAADLYGGGAAKFMPAGTSSAAQAMVLAVGRAVGREKTIVVDRGAHTAVVNALCWVGAKVKFVGRERYARLGISTAVTVGALRRVLADTPDVGAVILSSPSYEGVYADVRALADVIHDAGAIFALDQAWGSLFGLHPTLVPPCSVRQGADLATIGLHKATGSAGGTALLLLAEQSRVPARVFEWAATQLLSTSVPTPLLADTDLVRRELALHGARRIERLYDSLGRLRAYLRDAGLPPLDVSEWIRDGKRYGAAGWNPLTVVVDTLHTGYTGHAIGTELFERFRLVPAHASRDHVAVQIGLGASRGDVERVGRMIDAAVNDLPRRAPLAAGVLPEPPFPAGTVDLSGVLNRTCTVLPVGEAIGRRLAEPVIPYPPGYAVAWPGEVVTDELGAFLSELAAAGSHWRGPGGGSTVAVFAT